MKRLTAALTAFIAVFLFAASACSGHIENSAAFSSDDARETQEIPSERSDPEPTPAETEPAGPGGAVSTELEQEILEGRAVLIDNIELIENGIEIDVDSDGTKNVVTAEKTERFDIDGSMRIVVDGRPVKLWFSAEDELWFISLFGDSIEIARKTLSQDEYELYLYYTSRRDTLPEPEPMIEVKSLKDPSRSWDQCGDAICFYKDSASEIERCATIEEYVLSGASVEVCCPLLGSMDDNNDIFIMLDLDGDGERESIFLKAGRVRVFAGELTEDLVPEHQVLEVPYNNFSEDGNEIVKKYLERGFGAVCDPCAQFYVNANRFITEYGNEPFYTSRGSFIRGPEGRIILSWGITDMLFLGWADGEIEFEYFLSSEGNGA